GSPWPWRSGPPSPGPTRGCSACAPCPDAETRRVRRLRPGRTGRGMAGRTDRIRAMPPYAPATRLETHEVLNQPSEFAGRSLYETDLAFREAARREGGDWLDTPLSELGAEVGSETVLGWGEAANRHPPELVTFDRYGRRLDEVRFH